MLKKNPNNFAGMGKLVNPADLKFAAARLDGSIPSTRTRHLAFV